jgi:glycosyltransferase involved in cell wall biosynthesis
MYVLNAVNTIDRALSSVTSPDQPPVELLVMDGASTDGTVDVIRRYESKIAFWRSHRDGSAVVALNDGVARATGDIICLLPADDWVEQGALHLVQQAFRDEPELDVLSCGTRFVHYEPDGSLHVDELFNNPGRLELSIANIVKCPLTAGHFVARRMYQRLGGYDGSLDMSNDLDFLIRVCLQRPRITVLPQLVYTYRVHPQSRTLVGNPRLVMKMMRDNIRVAGKHLRNSPLRADERRELTGLHGRNSARFAWMLMMRGEFGRAVSVLWEALQFNPWWPVQVWYWLVRRLFRLEPRA